MNVNWNYPTAIRVGKGRIIELVDLCHELKIAIPLLVTDPALAGMPMVADIISQCHDAGLSMTIFSDIKPNPTGSNIQSGIDCYRKGNHDGIIAFGGGSGIDAGKAIAVAVNQDCTLWELEDIADNWLNADPAKIPPIIAVPTTAGTGSEVGRASVIINEKEHKKAIIFHPKMLPACVILDPELTIGLPAHLTAATGMDALSHNLEAYCSPSDHPMAKGIAVEGIRLIKDYLPTAVADGTDIEARTQMLVASTMGATAFQSGLGAMHALAHPLGAIYDVHHGLLNAVLMPYVLKANAKAIHDDIVRLAKYLDLEASFDAFLEWVLSLQKMLGIPQQLSEVIPDDLRLVEIGEMAVLDSSSATNPILYDAKAYAEILRNAYNGNLSCH